MVERVALNALKPPPEFRPERGSAQRVGANALYHPCGRATVGVESGFMADCRKLAFPGIRLCTGGVLSALVLLAGGCANVTNHAGEIDLDVTVTRGGQPAPYQRFIIWIDEDHQEKVTDRQGRITLAQSYPWQAQTLDVPGVGPFRHSPAPVVELRLAADAGHPIEGRRTLVKLPNDAWKLSIAVELPPS